MGPATEQDYQQTQEEIQDQVRIATEVSQVEVPENRHPTVEEIVDVTLGREMEKLQVDERRFEFQQRRAKLFAASGLFVVKNVTGSMAVAQAMVKIELGEAMGFTPAEALQGIYVINGVTSIASALRAARMQAAGYDWRIQWLGTDKECTGCRLWLYYRGQPVTQPKRDDPGNVILQDGKPVMLQVSEAFTKADAERMKTTIWDDSIKAKRRCSILEKENWQMSPRNMYFARAVTNLQRFHAPKVLNINIASTEEMMDRDTEQDKTQDVMRSAISIDQLTPSKDANRGHGNEQPEAKTAAKPEPKAEPKNEPKPKQEPKQEQKPEPAKADVASDNPPFTPINITSVPKALQGRIQNILMKEGKPSSQSSVEKFIGSFSGSLSELTEWVATEGDRLGMK